MWVQNQRSSWPGVDFFYASDRKMSDYLKDYYAALSAVDVSLGRIITWLRAGKPERQTVVVFYSDNGFLIGEHGLVDKRNAYAPSIRVPMLMWAPGFCLKARLTLFGYAIWILHQPSWKSPESKRHRSSRGKVSCLLRREV